MIAQSGCSGTPIFPVSLHLQSDQSVSGNRQRRVLSGDHCQCRSCLLYFNSTSAFDKHRVGEYATSRRCLSVTEMLAKGMAQNATGWWVTALNASLRSSIFRRNGDRPDPATSLSPEPIAAGMASPMNRAAA
jgi:hypothetical protein